MTINGFAVLIHKEIETRRRKEYILNLCASMEADRSAPRVEEAVTAWVKAKARVIRAAMELKDEDLAP